MTLGAHVRTWIPGARVARGQRMALWFAVFFYAYLLVMSRKFDVLMDMAASPSSADRFRALAALGGLALAYVAAVASASSRTTEGTLWGDAARRFQRNRLAVIGLCLFSGVLFVSLLAPLLSPHAPSLQIDPSVTRYQPPSPLHPLGTDKLGRDVLSRVLYGSQTSLSIGLLAVCLSSLIGLFFGAVAGYVGGWIDDVSMRIVDGLLAFPRLLIVLAVLAFFPHSFGVVILLLGLTGWMGVARLARGEVLRLKDREFVQAAVAGGAGQARLLWRHLLPNAVGPVLTSAALRIGSIIVLESSLSFLGLGVQPPTPSWGGMVSEGRDVLMSAWWVAAFPGLAVVIAVVSCNLVGDGLREATNPKTGA